MLPSFRLIEIELRAACYDIVAVVDIRLQHLLQIQRPRLSVHESEHDDAERDLHLRSLVQLVQHDGRIGVAL